jgi:hypothetical protein
MEKEKDLQKIYDLIEKHDFAELTESQKSFIRRHVTEEEYDSMRSTIKDTRELPGKIPAPLAKGKNSAILTIARYPVELYKMVAVMVLMTGLGILLTKTRTNEQPELLAMTDTVYIDHTDTVEIIKETIVFKNVPVDQGMVAPAVSALETAYPENNCSFEFCPDDMEAFRRTRYRGDFSNDSALADFMVTIQ